jgi:hypothetical protein
MACNQFDVPASTVACVAATPKSVLGSKAAANVCVKLTEVGASFDGATSSNAPAVCEFMQATFATNAPGTNSTTVTPAKRDTGRAETVQGTHAKTWTVEPTVLTLQRPLDIGQFNGVVVYMHPFASPFVIIGGQGAALRITSPNNVNFTAR